jgi:hypothetical protein
MSLEGYSRVGRATRDRKFLVEKQRRAGRDDVVMALLMQPVDDTEAD